MTEYSAWRRRTLLAAGAAAMARRAFAAPAAPITLSIMDVSGQLRLTRGGIERFQAQHPGLISHISYGMAPSPQLAAKLQAQQNAGLMDIDLVLSGPGALADGVTLGLWTNLLPDHADALPDFEKLLLPGAKMMQDNFGKGKGISVGYTPCGPLLTYAADRVPTPPRTPTELLEWTRAHPNRYFYGRPPNSGPSYTFLQGLPYILGDADPKDPVHGWEKTWSYLQALGENIESYPEVTSSIMKEFGDGSRDMVMTTCGWDISSRELGIVPKDSRVVMLAGTHWVPDGQFMCIPKGVPPEKLRVLLQLISFILQPTQQALTYDHGYLYPGPAIDVPISMSPDDSRQVIREFGRPEYDKWIADVPFETPLPPDRLVLAFRRWDEQIGSRKK